MCRGFLDVKNRPALTHCQNLVMESNDVLEYLSPQHASQNVFCRAVRAEQRFKNVFVKVRAGRKNASKIF